MKIIEIEGLVVSSIKYKESSKIINILTKDKLIGVIAKGALKIKSKLRIISDNLTYARFNIYYKEKGLSTLIEGDIIDDFKNIKTNLKLISYASYLIDLSTQIFKQEENQNIYNLLITSLKKIDGGLNPLGISNIMELKMLSFLGIDLNLKECVKCGKKEVTNISTLYGGYICQDCDEGEYPYSKKMLRIIKTYHDVDLEKINLIDVSKETEDEINKFLDNYYEEYSGLYLKTKSFLKNVNKLPN